MWPVGQPWDSVDSGVALVWSVVAVWLTYVDILCMLTVAAVCSCPVSRHMETCAQGVRLEWLEHFLMGGSWFHSVGQRARGSAEL